MHPRAPAIAIKFRRMELDFEGAELPRDWYANSQSLTHFFNALSAVFPDGEQYFIEAVRAFEHVVQAPLLLEQVREFTRQEGHHTHHHRRFNRAVAAMGVAMERCADIAKSVLGRMRARGSALTQLAETAAFEHFTALMGDWLLRRAALGGDMHPSAARLWTWHAAEEIEHKAVAFDVYNAAGGGYWRRIAAMLYVTAQFIPRIHQMQLILLAGDPRPLKLRDLLFCARYLYGRGGFISALVPGYLSYFRRDFHPWNDDNSRLLSAWSAPQPTHSTPSAA